MNKTKLAQLVENIYRKLNEAKDDKGKSKVKPKVKAKAPAYKSAKDIMGSIREEAEAEHMDSTIAKVQQEIENIKLEIQNKINTPVSGNVDAIHQDFKYLLKQMEALEGELEKLGGKTADAATAEQPTMETNETGNEPLNAPAKQQTTEEAESTLEELTEAEIVEILQRRAGIPAVKRASRK
jgi:hypothetical protein